MSKNKESPQIKDFTSKKLCQLIIVSRYLGSMRDEAINCMKELSLRRENGEVFDYENFIETEGKKLPDFKLNIRKKMQIGPLDLATLKGL